MIEKIIRDFLKESLDVPVFLEHQKKDPLEFVIFEKISSGERNKLKESTFAFQSYGKSLFEASKLNEKVKKIIYNLIFLDEIAFVKFETDYNFTEEETKRYRYQSVFNIKHY